MEGTGLVDDQRIGSKRGRDDEQDSNSNGVGRLEKRPSGIVLTEEYSYSGDEMINGVKYEEEKKTTATPSSPAAVPAPAGLFNQLISNLVSSPRSNETYHQLQSEKKVDDGAAEGRGEGNDAEQVAGGGNEKDGDGDGDASSGNLVDDIVAQLPRTLSEDTAAAPATDEVSILIHSIIHD